MNDPVRIGQTYFPARINGATPIRKPVSADSAFSRLLTESLQEGTGARVGLEFSQHARMRLEERNIHLSENDMARLTAAVDKAAAKGAKESLVLMNQVAFVVSVTNRTVITALDEGHMRGNVFTQIDSAVVL